jgi:hypothetical protein
MNDFLPRSSSIVGLPHSVEVHNGAHSCITVSPHSIVVSAAVDCAMPAWQCILSLGTFLPARTIISHLSRS